MAFSDQIKHFGNPDFVPEGWYWLLKSKSLKKKTAVPIEFLGKKIVLFRGETGAVHAMDAYCPHMGAHLCDGSVEGDSIVCPFHRWKFSSEGECVDIPIGGAETLLVERLLTYKVSEKYGLIWVWTGLPESKVSIPVIPELEGVKMRHSLGSTFKKNCHPNVVMINAIDAHHFTSVHNLVVDLKFDVNELSDKCIQFSNTTLVPKKNLLLKFMSMFYKKELTYEMTYWWGNTGSVMVGPNFLHFYIIFALRPTLDGKTEGQTILVTKNRGAFWGLLFDRVVLFFSKRVGNYFAKGDTIIFSRINFKFKMPVRADQSIIKFITHYEKQNLSSFFKKDKSAIKKNTEETSIKDFSGVL